MAFFPATDWHRFVLKEGGLLDVGKSKRFIWRLDKKSDPQISKFWDRIFRSRSRLTCATARYSTCQFCKDGCNLRLHLGVLLPERLNLLCLRADFLGLRVKLLRPCIDDLGHLRLTCI